MASPRRDRMSAGLAAIAVHAVLGYAFVAGLVVGMPAAVDDTLALFTVLPPPPPPAPQPAPQRQSEPVPEGAAAPPALTAKATAIVAPPPIVPPVVPPAIIAAPVAGSGSEARAGAAPTPGPGSGAGGQGTGTGSGREGSGGGAGGATAPRWLRGAVTPSDYPRGAAKAGIGGSVTVRYTVAPSGRAVDCVVRRSSGNADLDRASCRVVERRFRYAPARDADGRPVASEVIEILSWSVIGTR